MKDILKCAACSLLISLTTMPLGIPPVTGLIITAVMQAAAWYLGEHILPRLISLSSETYELHDRVSDALSSIHYGSDAFPSQWRIFVSDDDAAFITALGDRTLVVTRGCFNLRPEEFHCALQEAIEQRRSGRSRLLMLATVGNPVFLYARIFNKIGRFLFMLVAVPIGIVIAALCTGKNTRFMEGIFIGKTVGGIIREVTDRLYSLTSKLLTKLGDLSMKLYHPIIRRHDEAIDRRLSALSLQSVLLRLIEINENAPVIGDTHREACIVYRTPAEKRINALLTAADEQTAPQQGSSPRHTLRIEGTVTREAPRRSGHQIRIIR